jgi:hypothetical protein
LVGRKAVLERHEKGGRAAGLAGVKRLAEGAEAVPALAREAVELPHGEYVSLAVGNHLYGGASFDSGFTAGYALVDKQAHDVPALALSMSTEVGLLAVE